MIEIFMENQPIDGSNCIRTFYSCPVCKKMDYFYNFMIRECSSCDSLNYNIVALLNDIKTRAIFHKESEVK